MIEHIETVDGYVMRIEFDNKDSFDPEIHNYYDWLNEIVYLGEGEIYEVDEDQIDSSTVLRFRDDC